MLHIIPACSSTNSEILRLIPPAAPGDALMARSQTAGRGQRGNSWESAPGLNITLSLLLPAAGLPAARQFELSMAVSLGVADLLDGLGIQQVAVKWPNDVYVADGKIAGILIENSLGARGEITRSIAGVGLNVNQREFLSGAPNPVSLSQLTGLTYDVDALARRMIDCVLARTGRDNRADYRRRLWRGRGLWPWIAAAAPSREFLAEVVDILPSGHLLLSGCPEPFAFKQVRPAGYVN